MLHAEEEEEEKGCVLFHYTEQHSTLEKPPPIECIEGMGFAILCWHDYGGMC